MSFCRIHFFADSRTTTIPPFLSLLLPRFPPLLSTYCVLLAACGWVEGRGDIKAPLHGGRRRSEREGRGVGFAITAKKRRQHKSPFFPPLTPIYQGGLLPPLFCSLLLLLQGCRRKRDRKCVDDVVVASSLMTERESERGAFLSLFSTCLFLPFLSEMTAMKVFLSLCQNSHRDAKKCSPLWQRASFLPFQQMQKALLQRERRREGTGCTHYLGGDKRGRLPFAFPARAACPLC